MPDHRLITNKREIQNALRRVEETPAFSYRFRHEVGGHLGEGWLAHQLEAKCPLAVTGTKDAVDEKGRTKPQTVDAAKAVPLLWQAVRELSRRNRVTESKLDEALKSLRTVARTRRTGKAGYSNGSF